MDAGTRALGRDAAFPIPHIRHYLHGWGRPDDAGVVAVASGLRLGAAWYRLCPAEDPGWGFVASDVPELAMGVTIDARGRGIDSAMLDALLTLAREQGYRALSLSVDRQNSARRLYERKGFRDAGISNLTDRPVTMIAHLRTTSHDPFSPSLDLDLTWPYPGTE